MFCVNTMFRKIISNYNRSNVNYLSFTTKRKHSSETSTIDINEVEHFQKYSKSWWDEIGDMKTLHSLNKIRVPFIRDGVIKSGLNKKEFINTAMPLKDVKLLDVGCGGGLLSEPLARIGGNITGIDATKDLIEVAKSHAALDKKLQHVNYLCTSIEEFTSKSENKERFDVVVASEIIEHVCDQERFLCECVQCLKPGGSIFITTINKTMLSKIFGIIVAEHLLKIVPNGTHDYEKFVKPHLLQRMLEDYNCRTKVTHGMFYNYLTNNWSWISDTSVCYALHGQKMYV